MKQYMWAVLGVFVLFAPNTWAGRSPSVELDEDISSNCSGMIGTDVYNFCLRAATINAFNSDGNIDCIECLLYSDKNSDDTNPWVEALGVIAGPLASFGSNWVWAESYKKSNQHYAEAIRKSNLAWADAYRDTNEYWSNAYMAGYKACENNFNSYLAYTQEMLADPVTPQEAEVLATCNGQDLDLYAGYEGMYGGLGGMGMNPYLGAGYTNAMMAGLLGPYGLYGYGNGIGGGLGLGLNLPYGLSGLDGGLTVANPLAGLLDGGFNLSAGINISGGTGTGGLLNTNLLTVNGGLNGGGLGAQVLGYDSLGNPIYNTGGINTLNYNLNGLNGLNTTLNYGLPGTSILNTANGLANYSTLGLNNQLLNNGYLNTGINGVATVNGGLNERALVSQRNAQAGATVLANQAQNYYNGAANSLNNLNLTNTQLLTGQALYGGGLNLALGY